MGIGIATENIPKLLDKLPGGSHLVDGIEFVVGWARANSLWPLVYGTACCAMEMMSTGSSRHDWARFGVEVARATPRQADLIVLAGTIVEKMADNLVTLYEQMPGPKYVIAMGACACTGGPFYYDSYSVVKGGDRIIPVDIYIPGCPPRPETLLYGIMELQKMIRREGRRNPWRIKDVNTQAIVDPLQVIKEEWAGKEKIRDQDLAEARERFKQEHPDYKPFKPVRIAGEKFADAPLKARPPQGMAASAVVELVTKQFPAVQLFKDAQVAEEGGAEPDIADLLVPRARYRELVTFLRRHEELQMDFLLQLTAVDRQDHFDVVVHLLSTRQGHKVFVRCAIDRDRPEIETLTPVFKGANWHEREMYDLFGIVFKGHPDLRRFFLNEDFKGHPLRKDYDDPTRVVKRPY